MTLTTTQILAKRACGRAVPRDYLNWALHQLELDVDLPSIRLLAGIDPLTNPFEVDEYFTRALREGGLAEPSWEESLCMYAYEIADRVHASELDLDEALRELAILYEDLKFSTDLWPFFLIYHEMADQRAGAEYHSYIDVTEHTYRQRTAEELTKLKTAVTQRGHNKKLLLMPSGDHS